MRGIKRVATPIAIIGLLLFSSGLCFGQEVKVSLRVENQEVYLGESFIVQVIVEGAKADSTPVFENNNSVDIEYEGMRDFSQTMTRDINGHVTRTVTYQFLYQYKVKLNSQRVKELPKAWVTVGGKRYPTNSAAMTVKVAAETDEFKLRIQGDRQAVYVGEPMKITARWYLRQNIKSFEFSLPTTRSFDVYSANDTVLKKETLKAEILGDDTRIVRKTAMFEGKEFTVFEFEKVVIFRESGLQEIGPLTVQLKAIVGRRRSRDFFDMGGRDILKKHRIPSNKISIQVKALPPAPSDFTGLVGRPEIKVTSVQKRVRVGDPIQLTVKARCSAPLARIRLPNLQGQKISQRFKVSKPESPGQIQDGWKVQNWTIRAKDANLKTIPKISLSYFDPIAGRYSQIESEEIPLEVQKSQAVKLDTLKVTPEPEQSYVLEASDLGILHNIVDSSALINQSSNWKRLLFSWPTFISITPLFIYLVLVLIRIVKTQPWLTEDEKYIRRVFSEFERDLQQLKRGAPDELAKDLGRTLRALIADLSRQSRESFTTREAIDWIMNSREDLKSVIPILRDCDAAQFGGSRLEMDCLNQSYEIVMKARRKP